MVRVAVTGAAGFIGSNLCDVLLDAGYAVTGVDNFDPSYDRSIKERWIESLLRKPRFQFYQADICNAVAEHPWLTDADAVVHLAALAGVRSSVADAPRYIAVNVGGTTSVLDACVRSRISRVVFASSSSVYGERTDVLFREDESRLEPVSPYGVSKYAAELALQMYTRLHGLRVATLRFFSVYGPRQRPDQAICRFLAAMLAGEPVTCFGDGTTARDYTHVNDVVAGILGALDWLFRGGAEYQVFNIGSGNSVLLKDLLGMLGRLVGTPPVIREVPRPAVDVGRTCAAIDKARAALGYDPSVRIGDGLAQFKEWYEVTYGHQRSSVA